MAGGILKIRTDKGDVPIEYSGIAGIPVSDKTLSVDGDFADAKTVGDKFKAVNTDLSNKANGKGITLSINESGGLRVTYDDGK